MPSGSNARMSARRFSPSSSSTFDREPTETNIRLPSGEKSTSRVQWPPPVSRAKPGSSGDDRLGLAGRLGVAVLVGEADDRVGVGDVDVRRVRARRVEGDAERLVEARGEDLGQLGLAVAVGVAEDLDPAGLALGDEDVAVGGGHDDAGVGQAGGELRRP